MSWFWKKRKQDSRSEEEWEERPSLPEKVFPKLEENQTNRMIQDSSPTVPQPAQKPLTQSVEKTVPDLKEKRTQTLPPSPDAGKTKLSCPLCEENLVSYNYSGEDIFVCSSCGGYWCPANSLEFVATHPANELSRILFVKLKAMLSSSLGQEEEQPTFHECPKCHQKLVLSSYKRVVGIGIERCKEKCGTFVEKNVLEKIQVLEKLGLACTLQCPVCRESLQELNYSGESIFCCGSCGAYWCPWNTLEFVATHPVNELSRILFVKLQAMISSRLEKDTETPTSHECPRCREKMVLVHYKKVLGVMIEKCTEGCGTYIEKNILEKIQVLEKLGL